MGQGDIWHYAFTGGTIGDRLITKSETDPRLYETAANRLAPATTVKIVAPGRAARRVGVGNRRVTAGGVTAGR